MKKTLSMIVILSITLFAENKLDNQEIKIIQENKKEMKVMDKRHEEIKVIDASIKKKKVSIFNKFKEMEKIFDNYKCEQQKNAIAQMKADIDFPGNMTKEEIKEVKIIYSRLKSKLTSKCEKK